MSNTGSLTLGDCEFTDNTGLSNSNDVRCNNTSQLYLTGEVKAEVALNNTAKMYVKEALKSESAIVIRIINTLPKAGRVVAEFVDGTMESSKGYFSLHSQSKGSTLTFANNKATVK